jgi:hypothetical protein
MIRGGARLVIGAALVLLLAAGVPMAWVWVGSQVQGGTTPRGTAIVTVICGMIVTYSFVAVIAAWAKGRQPSDEQPVRFAWNRSLRDERYRPAATSFLENVLIAATILVAVIVTVWFFLFGSPGVPTT